MRLQVTRKTGLALRVLKALGGNGARRTTAELAVHVGATTAFLPQVMAPLVRAGWVESAPGPRGGYRLAVDADHLAVLDVVEAVEGPLAGGTCVLWDGPCPTAEPCLLHEAWMAAQTALEHVLGRTPATAVHSEQGRTPVPASTDAALNQEV